MDTQSHLNWTRGALNLNGEAVYDRSQVTVVRSIWDIICLGFYFNIVLRDPLTSSFSVCKAGHRRGSDYTDYEVLWDKLIPVPVSHISVGTGAIVGNLLQIPQGGRQTFR